jgi:hypothetical protein
MDKLVAEKVLEWKLRDFEGQDPDSLWPDEALHEMGMKYWPYEDENGDWRAVEPFSASLAASWKVDRDHWLWMFTEHLMGLQVYIFHKDGHPPPYDKNQPLALHMARWDEAPDKRQLYALARCRVALKAADREEGCKTTQYPKSISAK